MYLIVPEGQLMVEHAGHFSLDQKEDLKDQKEGKKINEVFNLSLPGSSF